MTYQPKIRRLQGGNVLEVDEGGEINVLAGATINVDGTLNIDGSPVEIAPVAVDEITDVDATAAELNYVAGVTPGTAAASKAAVLGADKNLDTLAVATLALGAGAGTAVTATAAELNKLDNATITAAELNTLDGAPAATTTIAVGAETGGDTITVTIQLKDANDADLATRAAVFAYLSDDANGDSIAGTAPSGGVAINTDGLLIPVVADKAFYLTSEADGDIAIDIVEASADTWYLILVLPNGLLKASGAITFAG